MEYSVARRRAGAARRRIDEALASGSHRLLAQSLRSYVRNEAVKYEAAYRTLGANTDLETVEQPVQELNLFRRDPTPVAYWRVPKQSRGSRIVCSLAPQARMRQVILKDALERCFTIGPHIFLSKRRGRDREANAILASLTAGFRYGYQADIKNAFANANVFEILRNTPLPAAVIQNNLYYRSFEFHHQPEREVRYRDIYCRRDDMPSSLEGPTGLIQGAASSSVIFAMMLNNMAGEFGSDTRLFVYGDNLLVLARSEGERAAARAILERYILTHPAGPFQLTHANVDMRRGFDRMGYRYERFPMAEHIKITLSRARRLNALSRLMKLCEINVRHELPPCMGTNVVLRKMTRGFDAITDQVDLREDMLFLAREYSKIYKDELSEDIRQAFANR